MKLRKGIFVVTSAVILAGGLGVQAAQAAEGLKINYAWWYQNCSHPLTKRDLANIRWELRSSGMAQARKVADLPDNALRYAMKRGCEAIDRYQSAEAANKALFG